MKRSRVRLELLVGRKVVDAEGHAAGRIESVQAEVAGDDCIVREFVLGPRGLMRRLGLTAGSLVGLPLPRSPRRIPWHEIDLSDPNYPRLVRKD
jgi:hypothetical protein